jgi:hypothetical protein
MLDTSVTHSEWRVDEGAIAGRAGSIDGKSGLVLMKESISARSLEYGFKMKAKQYQAIVLMIDGKRYMYSRGHWFNGGGFLLTPDGPDRRKGTETITSRDWASLHASMANDLIVFKYNGEVVAKCPIRTNPGGAHEVRVGFASHQVTVAVKDLALKVGAQTPRAGRNPIPGVPPRPPKPPDDF